MPRNSAKDRILDAAELLFWQQGYTATSIDDIVQKAGVSKGSFFYHFDTKEAALLAALDYYYQRDAVAITDKIFATDRPLAQQLVDFMDAMFVPSQKMDFRYGCLLGNTALELADRSSAVEQKIKQLFADWEQRLVHIFANRGAPRQTAQRAAELFLMGNYGAIVLSRGDKSPEKVRRLFDLAAQSTARELNLT